MHELRLLDIILFSVLPLEPNAHSIEWPKNHPIIFYLDLKIIYFKVSYCCYLVFDSCLDLACFLSKEIFHCHLFTILFWLYLSGTDPGLWTHSVNNSRKHLNWFCKMFQNFTSLFILKSRYRKKYIHAILCI